MLIWNTLLTMKSKSEWRKLVRGRVHDSKGVRETVLNRLVEVLNARGANTVLVYSARGGSDEINLTFLPDCLPMVRFEKLGNERSTLFPTQQFDVIIIPLLGFNEDGYRLGRGGGWYDRFLTTQPRALKIGVGYENTLVEFNLEPHDVRMDIIITEKNSRDFRKI